MAATTTATFASHSTATSYTYAADENTPPPLVQRRRKSATRLTMQPRAGTMQDIDNDTFAHWLLEDDFAESDDFISKAEEDSKPTEDPKADEDLQRSNPKEEEETSLLDKILNPILTALYLTSFILSLTLISHLSTLRRTASTRPRRERTWRTYFQDVWSPSPELYPGNAVRSFDKGDGEARRGRTWYLGRAGRRLARWEWHDAWALRPVVAGVLLGVMGFGVVGGLWWVLEICGVLLRGER